MSKLKDYDLYFIHIPKNAGTAFELQFCHKHLGHYKITHFNRCIWDKTIAIVRNPLTRLISLYNYAKLDKSYWHSQDNTTRYGKHELFDYCSTHTFEEFIKDVCVNHKFDKCIHIIPQHVWILTPEDTIVSQLVRFEHLNEDASKLLNKQVHVQKVNSSGITTYDGYYTEELTRLVKQHYKRDFELFI